MLRLSIVFTGLILLSMQGNAQTNFSFEQCQGSAMPYMAPKHVIAHPDSLTPVMINHVGRHGARYLTSSDKVKKVLGFLDEAEKNGTLTPLGSELRSLCRKVIDRSAGRWGTLDSLGMAEQEGIAARLCEAYPHLVRNATIEAISSYVPRCIMSMDCFTHEMARQDNSITVYTSSGRINSPLMRPFDIDTTYIDFVRDEPYKKAYTMYCDSIVPSAPALRLSDREINALWSARNLDQYLVRTASRYSSAPADIAAALIRDLISTTDQVIDGRLDARIQLRFGHAETMMPLLSLLRLPGCYYISDNLASVAENWQNFHVVPMASNLQLKLFRATSGRYYVRADFNEVPVPLIDGRNDIYVPWDDARDYLTSIVRKASLQSRSETIDQ